MGLRTYYGGATDTTLSVGIGTGDTSFAVIAGANLPNTGSGPFFAVIDPGQPSEEKILVGSVSGNTLSSISRGQDGTSAQPHAANAIVRHIGTATDLREANTHVNTSGDVHGVTGPLVGATSTQTLTNKTLVSPTINDPVINRSGSALTLPSAPNVLATRNSTETLTHKTLDSTCDVTGANGGFPSGLQVWTPTGSFTFGTGTVSTTAGRFLDTGAMVALAWSGQVHVNASGGATVQLSTPSSHNVWTSALSITHTDADIHPLFVTATSTHLQINGWDNAVTGTFSIAIGGVLLYG